MIKIIFSDMDGTLLDENGRLPAEFDEIIGELKKRGVIFAPTSGRQYFALMHQMGKYKDDFLFLAENGAYSCYREKEIFSSPIDKTEYMKVLNKAVSLPGIYPVVSGKKIGYVLREWEPYIGELNKYYTRTEFVDSFEDIDDEFIKLALADNERENSVKTIWEPMSEVDTYLHKTLSSNVWVDFLNPEANKGWAVKKIQEMFGFKPEECAAFGDYMNDYEMMQSVYYGYAMENAHPELKKVARFQCRSNVEHGVMEQIRELIRQGLI
ncbi:MAG: HAD family hydrolase [Lachnospiraceae bacterium]|nr:HAD family hydrolase [Lachnospiraceae bacterium]